MTESPLNLVLKIGYCAGIVLAFAGLILSAIYLFRFSAQSSKVSSFDYLGNISKVADDLPADFSYEALIISLNAERRMALLSTAIFVAMSFGFLGFSLFLIQADGQIKASGKGGNIEFNITNLAPGGLAILCSTIVILYCATYPITYRLEVKGPATENAPNPGDHLPGPAPLDFDSLNQK